MPTPANKIIPLYGAISEILLALDAKDQITARTVADAEIDGLQHLPAIGTHMRPNPELILSLQPDVVLQIVGRKEANLQAENLRSLGVPVLSFEANSFPQIFSLTQKLGILTGKTENAAKLISQWQQQLQELKPTNSEHQKPAIYFEARTHNLLAAGKNSIINDIIEAAGGKNIIQIPKKLVHINEETLLLHDPEICLIQKGPMNPSPTPLNERPNLKNLSCVRNNKIYEVDEKVFSRPGPNSIYAAKQLSKIILEK